MAEKYHGSQDTPRKPILLSYQREDNSKWFGIMVLVLISVVGGCLCMMVPHTLVVNPSDPLCTSDVGVLLQSQPGHRPRSERYYHD